MAISLSFILGLFGLIRVCLFSSALFSESLAIAASLSIIVFLSIVIGAVLPLSFQMIGLDPANSSTTIQVIMDISGVLITCLVATVLLDTELGLFVISLLRAGFA
jgi:Mg/Co/Ni transporter MgtE